MPRSVNHVASRHRRKKVMRLAKGYYGRRKNVWTVAKNAVEKGLLYAYRDRKLMGGLKKVGIDLNRKVLADLALNHPAAFAGIVEKVK
jgi:large subunit ribosomal protein L20